jgi:hypothetical protein
VGWPDGSDDGSPLGHDEGQADGSLVGWPDGSDDGWPLGHDEGKADGPLVGWPDGSDDGWPLGHDEGKADATVGAKDGILVGLEVGVTEGMKVENQTSRKDPPSCPPMTHILLSHTTTLKTYRAVHCAAAEAWVQVIPLLEYHTSFL